MPTPVLLPTQVNAGETDGVTYHIDGELVPALTLELDRMAVYFENNILLWKDPALDIRLKPLQGAFKRMLAGMPVFMTEARGPGRIAFSRDAPGHVFPLHVRPGHGLDVREYQFLAATDNVAFDFKAVKGVKNMLFGGAGLFITSFTVPQGEGCIWLHGYGNVFEVTLGPGEQIDIEPGGWLYKDASVGMEVQFQSFQTGLFASGGQIFWNRFTGPGRVGLQSMTFNLNAVKSG